MGKYIVSIQRVQVVSKIVGKDWTTIGERVEMHGDKPVVIADRGYTPEITKGVEESTQIFSQTVEDLDIPGVIKAINKI